MTFDEAKDILKDMKFARKRALVIRARIEELVEDYGALASPLGHISSGQGNNLCESTVERTVERVESEREKLAVALDNVYRLEDKLAESLELLEPTERDIITGYYLRDRTHWQLAVELDYSVETIKRKKRKAIEKFAQNCNVDPL